MATVTEAQPNETPKHQEGLFWIVAKGTLDEGHEFYGIFFSVEEANKWASNNFEGDYQIIPLKLIDTQQLYVGKFIK